MGNNFLERVRYPVDFIFGDANVVFQNCMIYVRKPTHGQVNVITAQGRGEPKKTGTVLHNCSIIADKEFEPYTMEVKTFLIKALVGLFSNNSHVVLSW